MLQLTVVLHVIILLAKTAKEHHRVEKSAPPHGHDFSFSRPVSSPPLFPSFPPLFGSFQVHHLPPIPPGD
jgi:hypothetical protein